MKYKSVVVYFIYCLIIIMLLFNIVYGIINKYLLFYVAFLIVMVYIVIELCKLFKKSKKKYQKLLYVLMLLNLIVCLAICVFLNIFTYANIDYKYSYIFPNKSEKFVVVSYNEGGKSGPTLIFYDKEMLFGFKCFTAIGGNLEYNHHFDLANIYNNVKKNNNLCKKDFNVWYKK